MENIRYISVTLPNKIEIKKLKSALQDELLKSVKIKSRGLDVFIEVDESDSKEVLYIIRDNTSADSCFMMGSGVIYLRGETIRTDLNTVRERIKEVLSDDNYKYVLDAKNYTNPVPWMKEHIQQHQKYLNSESGAVATLPYTIMLSLTGLGCTGRCVCDICKEGFNMSNSEGF